MKKMVMIYLLSAAALFFLSINTAQVFAAGNAKPVTQYSAANGQFHSKGHFKHNPQLVKMEAERLGIQTEGKDTARLIKEIRETKIKKKGPSTRY